MKKKSGMDMTEGSVLRAVILFMLPLIGGSIFQQLYNTVDFLFVGNFLDKTAAAAVGASATLINCAIGLFTGISVGTSVVMGHAIGAGRTEDAKSTLHTAVTFGIVGGIVLLLIGVGLAPEILRMLNTPEMVIPQAVVYMRIYMASIPMLIFYNMVSGGFRAEGDSTTPFIVLVICGFLNVLFDALFIVVLKYGIAGAAIATMFTQSMSAVLIGILAMRKNRKIPLSFKELRMKPFYLSRILMVGLPTGVQTIVITISNIAVQYFINGFGEVPVAAFATYYKVENLVFLFILAVGQASTIFTAQNMGARKYRRIWKGVYTTAIVGVVITLCTSLGILFNADIVFGFFMKDPDVVKTAVSLAAVSFPFYWVYPILETMGGSIRGMGYAFRSMVVVILNFCIIRIGLLVVFDRTIHSIRAIAAVYPITWASAAIMFTIMLIIVGRSLNNEKELQN